VKTTLDGQALFDEQDLTMHASGPVRASIERAVSGLDGTLSIDLGQRSREVRQTGTLRAASAHAMHSRVDSIAAFIDGRTHVLMAADGREYRRLRMDSFSQTAQRVGGPGVVVEYEIRYTQLGS
jgi:hypothetical protein